uniref:ATP-binding cassette domain-containing protein n=1 Tax=Rhodoblastus sp. TaxID=1962975 RepID=UPI0035ADF6A2
MALEIAIQRKAWRKADGGERLVFDGFSLSVAEGAIVALLGPSGCGKSTLLRIVAGLDRDFSGAATGAPERIGMAFQEPRLLPWRNVADNLRLAAPHLDETRLQELLTAFELAGRGGDYPGQLSLGLARRVALARAFAIAPQLVLLDEPFASLDRALHLRLRALLA